MDVVYGELHWKVNIFITTLTMSNMSLSGQGQMNNVTYGQGYAPIGEVRELGDHKQAGVSTVFLDLVF